VFRDSDDRPKKCILGLPKLIERHTGENIVRQIINIVQEYKIGDKIRYFTLDNASNINTLIEELTLEFGFDWKK
jgi:hypothetical protein